MNFFLLFSILLSAFTVQARGNVTVAYFGRLSETEFNEKIIPVFEAQTSKCKECKIVNWTPYGKDQKVDDSQIISKLKQLDENVQIVFFDWNDKTHEKNQNLIDELEKIRSREQFLVASAGAPNTDDKSCPLNQTVFGRVHDAIIIGELIQRDILWPRCHYGPEMLTAVRPPKDLMGQGVGPVIFVGRFAANFHKKKNSEWLPYLRMKKTKSRRIWPELEEFFPR